MSEVTTSADATAVRRWNERAVVEALDGEGRLRVAQVAGLTGLTPVATRDVLRSLEVKGWVRAKKPERSGLGRPARTFVLADPPPVLGVDVGGHTVRAVVLEADGRIVPLGSARVPEPRDSWASTLSAIAEATRAASGRDLWATGLALSGAIDDAGVVTRSIALPHFEGVDPAGALGDAVPGRLVLCHDTKAALWAETSLGAAGDVPHVMLVHLGRRPSIALMINGETYFGAHGTAGDLSLSELIPAWELEAGLEPENLAEADARIDPQAGVEPLPAVTVTGSDPLGDALRAAVGGEPSAVNAARTFFGRITPQLAFAAALVDPGVIVLAGALAPVVRDVAGDFADALAARVQRPPRVEVSNLDEYAVASGAALLARAELRRVLLDGPDGVAPLTRTSLDAVAEA